MKLKRYGKNPMLKPNKSNSWESRAVFNCGTLYKQGTVHMLYRADLLYKTIGKINYCISRLGYASSKDGIHFRRDKNPVFSPKEKYDKWGIEDPRIVEIEGKIYITYVALSAPPFTHGRVSPTALALTKDFHSFKRLGIITPENIDDRDTMLFPEKINGKYALLHRPQEYNESVKTCYQAWKTGGPSSIWLAYLNNLNDLRKKENFEGLIYNKVLMRPKEKWESIKVGSGPPPIKTKEGWLLIYHGVGYEKGIFIYRVGAALLDLKDPSRIIARTKKPLLEPKKSYEIPRSGNAHVVFPTGTALIDGKLHVYYGAADRYCCLATCDMDDLLSYLLGS